MDVDPIAAGHRPADQQRPAAVRRLPLGKPAFVQGGRQQPQPAVHLLLLDRRPARGRRSTCSLTQFAESAAFGPQNPTSGTPDPHRVHRVQPGETLDRISAKYYGDSTRWRAIAHGERHRRSAGPAHRLAAVASPGSAQMTAGAARRSPRSSRSTGRPCRRPGADAARRPPDLPHRCGCRGGQSCGSPTSGTPSRPVRSSPSAPSWRSAHPSGTSDVPRRGHRGGDDAGSRTTRVHRRRRRSRPTR